MMRNIATNTTDTIAANIAELTIPPPPSPAPPPPLPTVEEGLGLLVWKEVESSDDGNSAATSAVDSNKPVNAVSKNEVVLYE